MWFESTLWNEIKESDENLSLDNCFMKEDKRLDFIEDLISLNVTKDNYKVLLELCDYLMIENCDIIIDRIVDIHDYDYSILYEFEDFYIQNTTRIIAFDEATLKEALQLY